MKADTIRLATVFHEAGMIDEPTYEQCKEISDPKAKSFADALKKVTQNVSFKNIGELMTADLVPSGKKSNDSTLHDILSQPLFLSQDQIRSILCAWKPAVGDLVARLNACGIMPDGTIEAVKELGRGTAAYDRLIERGYLDSNSVNRVVSANHLPHKRMNRLLLALNCLKHNGMLSQADCDLLLQKIEEKGESQIPVLNQEILDFIGSDPELPELNLAEVEPIDTLRKMLPSGFIRQSLVLPCQRVKSVLEIVTSDPFHFTLIDSLSFLTGVSISVYHASTSQLISRINAIYPTGDAPTASRAAQPSPAAAQPALRSSSDVGGSAPVLEEIADNRTTVGLVTSIIEGGVKHKATDIHLEPQADGKLRVRYRIDGRLREVMDVPPEMMLSVISRIKVLSNLDVTERRRPQDGHFSLHIGEGAFDFRVSSLPTHVGEKVVIRILDESRVMLSLASLGIETDQAGMVAKWISRPHGLVLVTGPTGSGKTSTLYASLNTVNSSEKNIVTIEDPVEYQIAGINQVQVDSNIDLGFAEGLRSILRQDPDVIMVGEIRDTETARIAMRAALTGHLVFSTLHTNTAVGAIATLSHMGIEPYMLVSAITGVISQRLLRKICASCKKAFTPTQELLQALRIESASRKRLYRGQGCDNCMKSGYEGRTGLFELMPLTEEIRTGILTHRSEHDLVAMVRGNGIKSLLDYATIKLYGGIISPEEVLDTLIAED